MKLNVVKEQRGKSDARFSYFKKNKNMWKTDKRLLMEDKI